MTPHDNSTKSRENGVARRFTVAYIAAMSEPRLSAKMARCSA